LPFFNYSNEFIVNSSINIKMKKAQNSIGKNVKIFAFPFAGGNESSFNKIFQDFNNVLVYNYPGRGDRIDESPIIDIYQLVDDLYPKFLKELTNLDAYYIYGHSLGAMVAFLIAKRIEEDGVLKPTKLIVTGFKPPSYPRDKFSHFVSDKFWERLTSFGGIPIEFIEEPLLQQFFEPILRCDIKLWESYNYSNSSQLSIPIDVFYGSEENITYDEMCKWKNESSSEVLIKEMEGGHFFILNYLEFFQNYFNDLIIIK